MAVKKKDMQRRGPKAVPEMSVDMAGRCSSENPRARTSVVMDGGCSSQNPRVRTTHVHRCPDRVFLAEGHMLETASHSAARGHNVKMCKTRALSTYTFLPVKSHTLSPLRNTQHVPRRTLFGRGGELLHCSKREQQSDRTGAHMITTLGDHKLPGSAQSPRTNSTGPLGPRGS